MRPLVHRPDQGVQIWAQDVNKQVRRNEPEAVSRHREQKQKLTFESPQRKKPQLATDPKRSQIVELDLHQKPDQLFPLEPPSDHKIAGDQHKQVDPQLSQHPEGLDDQLVGTETGFEAEAAFIGTVEHDNH